MSNRYEALKVHLIQTQVGISKRNLQIEKLKKKNRDLKDQIVILTDMLEEMTRRAHSAEEEVADRRLI